MFMCVCVCDDFIISKLEMAEVFAISIASLSSTELQRMPNDLKEAGHKVGLTMTLSKTKSTKNEHVDEENPERNCNHDCHSY